MNRNVCRTAALCVLALSVIPCWARQAQTRPTSPEAQSPAAGNATFNPSRSDEKAVTIAEQVIEAMGAEAWERARFIKFTWVWQQGEKRSAITHYWDRYGQRSRMEGPSSKGEKVIAVVDHSTKEGKVSLDGELASGAAEEKYVKLAYDRLINDSYWFFMPFKLKDPGVRLRYEGEVGAGDNTYDKIRVSFEDGTGLTPGDKYWIYVDRKNHRIKSWSYRLEAYARNASPVAWDWEGWQEVGGMSLALLRTQPGGESKIFAEQIEVYESLPPEVFTEPHPFDGSGVQVAGPAGE